ncbi:MAG: hypothetical protein Q9166_007568 [cf. Caloplaca sp. 2 TL-2023]
MVAQISSTNPSPRVTRLYPWDILHQELFGQVISPTASDLFEASTQAFHAYNIIGIGSRSVVFSVPGTQLAVKKGKDINALWNDFRLTNTVYNAFLDVRDLLQDAFPKNMIPNVPRCSTFGLPSSTERILDRYPVSHKEAECAFYMDRIPSLPQHIREALIGLYFAEGTRDAAKMDDENEVCLPRIYLGKKELPGTAQYYNSLRNFPLLLDMIEELILDKDMLVDEMAIGLAVIHWQAQIDARGAKFVLGGAQTTSFERRRAYIPARAEEPHDIEVPEFTMRSIHIWVLDFGESNPIELLPREVCKLVTAFLLNDPYYPRPDVDKDLWTRFSRTYIKASRLLLQRKGVSNQATELPKSFINSVVATIKKNRNTNVGGTMLYEV